MTLTPRTIFDDTGASTMAGVERQRRNANPRWSAAFPVVLTLLNLAFCAWIHPKLRNDPEGYELTLYLLVQISVFVFFILGMFLEQTVDILCKVRVFPVSDWSRFVFLVLSNLGSFAFVLYWSANVVFLIFHYRTSIETTVAAVALFTVLTLCIVMIGAVFLGRFVGTPSLPRRVIVGSSAVLVSLFAGIFVFRVDVLLYYTPLLAWTVDGIFGAQEGDYFTPFLFFCIMLVIILSSFVLGRLNFGGRSGSKN